MLISCVLPTRGRREWAALAVESFLSQDYANKELVILDDLDDSSFPTIPTNPLIRYYCEPRRNIIDKRNRVNELAKGELICHFDSDDWSDRTRLSQQVAFMKKQGKAVVGFNTLLFYEPSTQKVARYIGTKRHGLGTSLLYRKSFWEAHPFRRQKLRQVVDYGSDIGFMSDAHNAGQLAFCEDTAGLIVARVHPDHTSTPTAMYKMNQQLTLADLPAGFPR